MIILSLLFAIEKAPWLLLPLSKGRGATVHFLYLILPVIVRAEKPPVAIKILSPTTRRHVPLAANAASPGNAFGGLLKGFHVLPVSVVSSNTNLLLIGSPKTNPCFESAKSIASKK